MKIEPLSLSGLYSISEEPISDPRGEFSRVFCSDTFRKFELVERFAQVNRSLSRTKGTLRGLHFQIGDFAEAKYVRVLSGSIFDVAVDVRLDSQTYLQWEAVTLNSETKKGFYLSPGFAHGIMTLEDDTEMEYFVSQPYNRESERGHLWNDPRIGIEWPLEPSVISEKDKSWEMIL